MIFSRSIRAFRHVVTSLFPALPAVGLFLLTACQSEPVSYQTPVPAAPTASAPANPATYGYPNPIDTVTNPGGATSDGVPSPTPGFGSVTALPPTPISTENSAGLRVTAKAAILVDGSGRVLFEKNANIHLPSASTQKLLLALLVTERGNLVAPVTIAEADTWAEPTVMGIKPGEVYTRDELLHAVLIRSCNDIARALGRDHSGSEAAFVANLNARARQLGMSNSYFTNSNGLPSPAGQYSTARDLATLGLAALRNPRIREICRMQSYPFRMANGSVRMLTNTNLVLKSFPYCTGLKTGTTNAAGKCLISSASYGGKTVVAVMLGGKSPSIWQESEALLKYGLGL